MANTAKWTVDPSHSSVGFWVRHLMVSKVHGSFTKWSASIDIDDENPARSSVEAQIETASIDTREAQRDGHLRTAEFFDVEQFPHMTFKSTSIQKVDAQNFRVTGDLTIKGVTQSVVLEVEDEGRAKHPFAGDLRAAFSARTSIKRSDFGLTWNAAVETGGVVVSDKVEIVLEIQAAKPA
jgi:polyisoprenoid-binding protein YceI